MDQYDEQSKENLLDETSECSESLPFHYHAENGLHRRPSLWWRTHFLSLAIFCLMLYVAILETVGIAQKSTRPQIPNRLLEDDQPSLIPKGTLQYEQKPEWSKFAHPWNIPPSPELDDVWEEFLHARNVRVTQDELTYLSENLTDLVQVDNGDYPGVLGIFHHLHCLNNLRKIVHWDYYQSRVEDSDESLSKGHSDHCIDAIRQTLMCHANTAVYTAEWLNDTHHPLNKDLKSSKHATCVRWESLDGWARQRALVPGTYHYRPGPYPPNKVMSEG